MSLEKCLHELVDNNAQLSHQTLIELSDLSPLELEKVARVWGNVPSERKCKVVERLVEMAEDNPDLDFSAIFKACFKDSAEIVREKAISGLWEFEDRSIIPMLIELLKCDGSTKVRAAASIALSRFAELAQDGKILFKDGERVKEALMNAIQNGEEALEVRRRALEAMAPFNDSQVREYIRWAYNSSDLGLRCSSIYAMGKTGESGWLPLLIKELRNPAPALRYEAANACAELGGEEVVPYIVPLLQDDDLQVQLSAIGALGAVGSPLAKRALKRCLKTGDPAVEDAAQEALENIDAMEDPLGFKLET